AMVLRKVGLGAGLGPFGTVSAMVAVGLVSGMVFHFLVERPMLRVLSKNLVGRRREAVAAANSTAKEIVG
ncbi:MAG: hypothetical protein WAU86_22815, partial [Oricola sp.]